MTELESVPVTVVIPAYNAEAWLERSVLSVVDPNHPIPGEIVIVDDASADGTATVAARLAEQHPNIRLILRENNGGPSAAILDGCGAATNEWIALLASDDYLAPGALADAFGKIVDQGADLCIWDLHRVRDDEAFAYLDMSQLTFPMSGRAAARLTLGAWSIHPLGIVRRSLYLAAAAGIDVDSFNSDELVSRRLLLSAEVVTACSSRYYYVDHAASVTKSEATNRIGLIQSSRWLLQFAKDNGFLQAEPDLAVQMVRQSLGTAEELIGDPRYTDDPANRARLISDLPGLVEELRRCNPHIWVAHPRLVVRSVRRIRAIRSLDQRVKRLTRTSVA